MVKTPRTYQCSACGAGAIKWHGRCPKCGEFGTVGEVASSDAAPGRRASVKGVAPTRPARPVASVTGTGPVPRVRTGVAEFDRVIGGGLVAGQVLLCSGPPGSGKSTLVLAVADSLARRTGRTVLYISGEESVEQLAIRAQRLSATSDTLLLADDSDVASVIGHIDAHGADVALVIIDSIQTIASAEVEGRAGGVTQVMEVAQALTRVAKERGIPMLMIGQVTKDSSVAGPRALEHAVL